MTILMVIGQFRPIVGGAERQCELLARALTARGHAVCVLTVRPERGISTREIIDSVRIDRVVYPIATLAGHRIGFGVLAPLLLAWRAWRVLPRYDVVIAHQALWPAFVVAVVARLRGKPIIVKLGNSGERFDLDVLRRSHWYGAFARRSILRNATRFIATSSAVRGDLLRTGVTPERIEDIPNGVALTPIPIERSASDTLRAVFVGTLTPKKNVAVLLAATARLPPADRMRTVLTIVGDGPERAALERQAAVLGITDRVTFRGTILDPSSMLAESDILVLPSRTEGLSNAALEACAVGRALLVSNAGGNPDLVPDAKPDVGQPFLRGSTGILVNPESLDAITAGLQWFRTHHDERRQMGERARALIDARYAIVCVADAYEQLFHVVTRPRVVHLLTFLDAQTGGMEHQARQLAERLRSTGHAIFFITTAHARTMHRERLPWVGERWGFRIYRIPFVRGWRRWNAAAYCLGAIVLLVVLRKRYDIIHAHQLHTSGVIASIARRLLPRKRVIVKNACGGLYGDVGELQRQRSRRALLQLQRGIDQFVGVGDETAAEMDAAGCGPIACIPNGVRTDHYAPPTMEQRRYARRAVLGGDAAAARLVLSVGRLHAQKNLITLMDAVALLPDDVILVLVGDGPERVALERYREQRGVAQRVRFAGPVEDVLPYYHAADMFVLASRSEGMPNVVLEAMACGLPIVGSDIPPVRALIRPGTDGVLVHPDDADGFARAIREIIGSADRARAMGQQTRARAVAQYSIDASAEQYAMLYHTLMASRARTV